MTLKVVGVDPKRYFNSDMLLYMKFRMLSTVEYRGFVELLNSVGRPFDVARSNYVVPDYHTELVKMITALELTNLNISNCSLTFDDSCSSIKIKCYRLVYKLSFLYLGSLQRAFTH
jgi:hypothetical protein